MVKRSMRTPFVSSVSDHYTSAYREALQAVCDGHLCGHKAVPGALQVRVTPSGGMLTFKILCADFSALSCAAKCLAAAAGTNCSKRLRLHCMPFTAPVPLFNRACTAQGLHALLGNPTMRELLLKGNQRQSQEAAQSLGGLPGLAAQQAAAHLQHKQVRRVLPRTASAGRASSTSTHAACLPGCWHQGSKTVCSSACSGRASCQPNTRAHAAAAVRVSTQKWRRAGLVAGEAPRQAHA